MVGSIANLAACAASDRNDAVLEPRWNLSAEAQFSLPTSVVRGWMSRPILRLRSRE